MDKNEWEKIYTQLYAYTDQLLKSHQWFRKGKIDSYLKGKQVHDYVMEAIEHYMTYPEKYDTSFNRSLVNYLKLHIIRRNVGNDSKKIENKSMVDLFATGNEGDENEPFFNLEALLPFANAYFDQEIDYNEILASIKVDTMADVTVNQIFEGICHDGLKRREVIELYKISEVEFDNGMKRLKTILKNTAKKYELLKI